MTIGIAIPGTMYIALECPHLHIMPSKTARFLGFSASVAFQILKVHFSQLSNSFSVLSDVSTSDCREPLSPRLATSSPCKKVIITVTAVAGETGASCIQGQIVRVVLRKHSIHMEISTVAGWKSTSRHSVQKSGVKNMNLTRCGQK